MARSRRALASLAAALATLVLLTGFGPCPGFPPKAHDLRPMVFVHGGSGSGAQFESQALRFTSNGYPQDYVRVLEYDSSSINTILPDVHAELDALIAELQTETGAEQVDLLGHSLGGFVSLSYMADPGRAASIAHYVSLDSGSSNMNPVPPGVPTLALWAGAVNRPVPPMLVGATNLTIPDQEHVEVATSEESFFEIYRFFRDRAPFTTRILPELRPRISGRVVAFPQNTGLDGATLEVWWVDGRTGERIGGRPRETFAIGPDGSFGPFKVWYGLHYELAVVQEGEVSIHYFYEPFLRSDHLVRLNVASDLGPFIESSEDHTALTIVRYKEFWGDRGAQNDVLAIDGTDVVNPATAPSGAVGAASVSFFLFDVGSDGVSDLTDVPFPFDLLGFLTGADLFIPSQPPGSVEVETVPRGDFAAARTVNVPNLPSTESRVVVQLNDFEQ